MARKILAIVLSLALVFALCLTACGGETAETEDTTKATEKETTKATEKETTVADTDEEEFALETVDWYCRRSMDSNQDFWDYVWPTMQEYFLENLNIQAEWHGFAVADYNAKFQAAITANTAIDLMFVPEAATGLSVWVSRNALEPLDDLLDKYAQELVADMPDYAFQSAMIDGVIYGMPTNKDLAVDIGLFYNETMLQDLGLYDAFYDVDFQNAKDYDDFFHTAKAARDEAYPDKAEGPTVTLYNTKWAYYKGDEITTGVFAKIADLRCFEDQPDTGAFALYQTQDYADAVNLIHQWVVDGINPYDAQNFDKEGEYKKNGDYMNWWSWGTAAADRTQYEDYGWIQDLRHPKFSFTYTGYPLACFHSINAMTTDSKKVASMRLYNMLAEDRYVATSMRYGVEGVHWKLNDDGETSTFNFEGSRNIDPAARNYYVWGFAEFGRTFSTYLVDTMSADYFPNLNAMNENAKPSTYMGFILDTEPVANEIAALANVEAEYNTDLFYGMIEDVAGQIDSFNAALEANGMQTVLDECNTQMAAWLG